MHELERRDEKSPAENVEFPATQESCFAENMANHSLVNNVMLFLKEEISSWCAFAGLLSIRLEKKMIVSTHTGEASAMQKYVPLGTVLQECHWKDGESTETILITGHFVYRSA